MLYKTPIIYGNKQFVPAEFLPVTQAEDTIILKLKFFLRNCKSDLQEESLLVCNQPYINIWRMLCQAKTHIQGIMNLKE